MNSFESQDKINDQSLSLKHVLNDLNSWLKYLKTKLMVISFVTLIGGILGFIYANFTSIKYIAKLTFVVEDGKSSGGGLAGLASLAGQFGVDVGLGGNSGLLSGENIIYYLKSKSLAKSVLLKPVTYNSNILIADLYSETHDLKRKWKKNKQIGDIFFGDNTKFKKNERLRDSLLNSMIDYIIEKQIEIEKIDKKAGFISVTTKMQSENLSKIYCELLVKEAVNNFITLKIQRQKSNVDKLQVRVDSILKLLNSKTIVSANLQTTSKFIDINPLYSANTIVTNEKTSRDKTILSTIFVSAIQNLELAKFALTQETPVIQLVDLPILPLERIKTSKVLATLVSSFIFFTVAVCFVVIKRILSDNFKN